MALAPRFKITLDASSGLGAAILTSAIISARHKVTGARETIQACGAPLLLDLPHPYRPDFNLDLELAFSSASGKQPQHAPSMPRFWHRHRTID